MKRAGRQWTPRFPPALEALYDRETRAERLRAMKLCTLLGCFTGVLFGAMIWEIMPDAQGAILRVWFGGAIPVGLLCHALLWHRRASLWLLEWQVTVAGLIVGACLTHVMVVSEVTRPSFYFGGTLLLIQLDATAARLRWRPAVAVVVGLVAMFAGGLPRMHGADAPSRLSDVLITVLMATCAFYALFGTWRLETETRRSYALALRERIERHELSRRNEVLGQMLGDDALTGLANRRGFDELLAEAWSQAAEFAAGVALVMIDIDSFKAYNDTYGHPAGDTCLRAIAACLRDQMRGTTDVVARLGGEEFAIVLPGMDATAATAAAEAVRLAVQTLAIPHRATANGYVTISAGVAALYAEPGTRPGQLIEAADQALYAAKRGGRNRVIAAIGVARATAR
jgi:diguanylate cyclase (GGDEF)-like protein